MDHNLQPGLKGNIQRTVTEKDTATHVGSGNASVLASPVMICWMEVAAMETADPQLPQGYRTVGIHVDVKHIAPTPLGMRVTARAELLKVEGKVLTFRVTAEDEKEVVGEGTHQRAIIELTRFQERVRSKGARQ